MRILIKSALPLICIALAGCQTINGPAEVATFSGTALEEPFVATDQPMKLGREHFARGHYALAGRYFQTAVEATPQDGDAWIGLAASYDQLSRFDLADRAYAQAEKIKGPTPQVLNNRGYSYLLRGDAAQAERMFQRARAQNPGNQTVANNLALVRRVPR
jgi:Flp pilus assembly protein TadD